MRVFFLWVFSDALVPHIVFPKSDWSKQTAALFGGGHYLIEFVFVAVWEIATDLWQVVQIIIVIFRSEEEILSFLRS